MKKYFITLLTLALTSNFLLAQPPQEDRIPEKMSVFIAKRMLLNPQEMEQFKPVFARYHKEWRESMKKNREDRLLMQQQIIELQIRYRKEFAPIVGEKQVIHIYDLQQDFIRILRDVQRERMQGPGKRGRGFGDRMDDQLPPPPPPPRREREEE